MFGWFKGASKEDTVELARQAADALFIESVVAEGLYTGFLIQVPAGRDVSTYLKDQTALAAFVDRIEARLDASDFEPVLEAINNIPGIPSRDHSEDRARAVRAVVSNGGTLLFKWSR
jgi:hypothetical protein